MKILFPTLLVLLTVVGCDRSVTSNSLPTTPANVDRDNTAVNKRDRPNTPSSDVVGANSTATTDKVHTVNKTPIDQNENQADINITADIRKQVVATKLSVNAHNVKIITQDGKVTLRGPVKTEEEKKQIEEIAVGVAGKDKVDNQLEVETKP